MKNSSAASPVGVSAQNVDESITLPSCLPKAEGICDDDGATLSIRADDTLEAVQNRLEVYEAATKPLISWYTNNGLIKTVDASVAPEAVFDSVKTALGI